jgi:putative toxin-antitoxin system antitoxin component (TIGR02293 family)
MAKAPLGRAQAGKPQTFAPADPASLRVEQAQAEYAVAAARMPASIVPAGAAGAWLLYRDSLLDSPPQTQISEIRKGAPASNLIGMAEALRVPRERVYHLIGLSSSTAKRKLARDETLDPLMTERLIRLGAIERLAEDTFGDAELASAWLQTGNLGLGNETPLSLLDTEVGCREVSRVLNAIAYGAAA